MIMKRSKATILTEEGETEEFEFNTEAEKQNIEYKLVIGHIISTRVS